MRCSYIPKGYIHGVLVKNESRINLYTSDHLKLSAAAKEGLNNKFFYFELNGKIGEDVKTVYDLPMRIDIFFKSLTYYDMVDVFQIISASILSTLNNILEVIFGCQE